MYTFLESKGILKNRENECWTYLLEDADRFSKYGYKSAQLQLRECMLKCSVIKFNGQLKFIYYPEGYKNLIEILGSVQPNKVWNVFEKVLDSIIKIKKFGFLACSNIDIEPQNIYIDPKTFEAHLIYVPLVSEKNPSEQIHFESALRQKFVLALRESNNMLLVERENKLFELLNYAGQSIEELHKQMLLQSDNVGGEHGKRVLRLVSNNKNISIDYTMHGDEIKIGRSKTNNIVIDFTNQISRLHCTVFKKNGRYYLQDEKSTHGTFLNGKKCTPLMPMEIHHQDRLSLISPQGIQMTIKIQTEQV